MIEDLASLAGENRLQCDVCIVGAGPAGITIALELMGSGLSVCLVESGGYGEDAETHRLYEGESVGHLVKMTEGRHRVLGGSATRWSGRSAVLDPIDFEARPWVNASGWPISYEAMLPYYERAKRVSNFPEPWLADAAVAGLLGIDLPAFTGGMVAPYIWRVASPDMTPSLRARLELGYRRAFDWGSAYRARLAADPTTRVLLHANLIGLDATDDGARIARARVSSIGGNRATIEADRFVLCCSGIENARLLLNAPAPLRARIDASGTLGRYLTQHPRGSIGTIVADRATARRLQRTFNNFLRPRRVPIQYEIGFVLTEAAQRAEHLVNASAALVFDPGEATPWKAGRRLRNALRARRAYAGIGGDLAGLARGLPAIADNIVRRYLLGREVVHAAPRISINIDLEQEPIADSRITLSERRDRFGTRLAKADWRVSEIERRTARRFAHFLGAELERLGFGHLEPATWLSSDAPISELDLLGNYHFIGTTRMAANPADGVVDPESRAHGVENLFVAGSSVFPTGGHANPTLTIVALAIRLADHLRGA